MCGDTYEQHEHYRAGLDCSVRGCPCRSYVAARWWRVQLAAFRADVARGWRAARPRPILTGRLA
jgi:hypothetical protein